MQYGYCNPNLGIYRLSEHIRLKFKNPIGHLYKPEEVNCLINKISEYIQKGFHIISVGDRVTLTLINHSIPIKLAIIDKKERRHNRVVSPTNFFNRIVVVRNEAGTINFGICKYIIESFYYSGNTLIFVIGEEDLVATLTLLISNIKAIMVYGQPLQGIVLCQVNENLAKRIIKMLEVE